MNRPATGRAEEVRSLYGPGKLLVLLYETTADYARLNALYSSAE